MNQAQGSTTAAHSPGWRRVLAQTRFETAAVMRNGEQLLLTVILPVIALVVMTKTSFIPLPEPRPAAALAGALALAVAAQFTSQAISLAFDRRWGVLRLLATTPLGARGLLTGRLGAVLGVLTVQVLVLVLAAVALGWRPGSVDLLLVAGAALLLLLGAAAFVALAFAMGGALRTEAVLAGANLLWILLAAGGGLVVPADSLPQPADTLVRLLPSGALGEGLRSAVTGSGLDLFALAVLTIWVAVGTRLATRVFRWD
ncbi:ABC transporter permease [Bogoriella caseilytica]|uniref:ABC-2 type transport system permease protein n=1 Tax=Bogoriella caseilytica TaxID=56055 RepID=A0A3N2BG54_9MICO|nr:ABC transporter permease [Bogoriella caseilytica]ROR74239.1 ABC-2 type transport system permease protein [Bogoriella caseilytica]